MHFCKKIAVAAICLAAFNGVWAEEAFINLRPSIAIEGRTIRLGDIAEIALRDTGNVIQWRSIEIGKLASLSSATVLSQGEINRQVMAHAELRPDGISWGGSQNVAVTAARHRLDLSPYINSAAALLLNSLSTRDSQVTLALLDDGGNPSLPNGRISAHPELSSMRRIGSNLEIPLSIIVDNELIATPLLHFSVSRRALAIHSDDGREQKAEIRDAKIEPITLPSESNETSTVQTSVMKNHSVPIVIQTGSVQIESSGIALADARAGDEVSVRRSSNGTTMTGRATASGTVVVEDK